VSIETGAQLHRGRHPRSGNSPRTPVRTSRRSCGTWVAIYVDAADLGHDAVALIRQIMDTYRLPELSQADQENAPSRCRQRLHSLAGQNAALTSLRCPCRVDLQYKAIVSLIDPAAGAVK
jgi:hypothetical protein